jgi:hypothetical protein
VDWNDVIYPMPKYKVGDILWVRETFREYFHVDRLDEKIIEYKADNPPMIRIFDDNGFQVYKKDGREKLINWKPSIFMPKEAARIFLRIMDIRVERLQDISEEDAIAEGIEIVNEKVPVKAYKDYLGQYNYYSNPINSFKSLWESINGEKSWEQNPYVWVIHFEKITKPTK